MSHIVRFLSARKLLLYGIKVQACMACQQRYKIVSYRHVGEEKVSCIVQITEVNNIKRCIAIEMPLQDFNAIPPERSDGSKL